MGSHRFAIAVAVAIATMASQAVVASAACAASCEAMQEAAKSCCPLAPRRPPTHSLKGAGMTCCDAGVVYAFEDALVEQPERVSETKRLIAVAPIVRATDATGAVAITHRAYPRPPPPPGSRPNSTIVLLL